MALRLWSRFVLHASLNVAKKEMIDMGFFVSKNSTFICDLFFWLACQYTLKLFDRILKTCLQVDKFGNKTPEPNSLCRLMNERSASTRFSFLCFRVLVTSESTWDDAGDERTLGKSSKDHDGFLSLRRLLRLSSRSLFVLYVLSIVGLRSITSVDQFRTEE